MSEPIALLLLTYGSPDTLEDVEEYLTNIKGSTPDAELVAEFRRRYETIGGSPLTRITREQARGAARSLQSRLSDDTRVQPYVGMRYYEPYIEDAVDQIVRDGAERIVALILSPQYSPILMEGYDRALVDALRNHGDPPALHLVHEWWDQPLYQDAVADRIDQTLDELPSSVRNTTPLLLTAHSIPRRVADRNPEYVRQLKETARGIGKRLDRDWEFAYQSAGHTKEEWLKPDMTDLFPGHVEEGHRHVVIAPFQFLSDHLEILYDIDVAARRQAEETGLEFHRIEALNTYPKFLEALGSVARDALTQEPLRPSP